MGPGVCKGGLLETVTGVGCSGTLGLCVGATGFNEIENYSVTQSHFTSFFFLRPVSYTLEHNGNVH